MKFSHLVLLSLMFFVDLKVKADSYYAPGFVVAQNQVAPVSNDLNQALTVPENKPPSEGTPIPPDSPDNQPLPATSGNFIPPENPEIPKDSASLTPPSLEVTETVPQVDSDVQTILEAPGTGRLENVNLSRARALVKTNMGRFSIKFYGQTAPRNVENFLALALGKKVYVNGEGRRLRQPFYNGLHFFKVVPGFILQAGCPINKGLGGPGYSITDEISPDVAFDKAGVIGMSNYGANTNGSQFFITLKAQPLLNTKFTAIGEVDQGLEVIKKMGRTMISGTGRPVQPLIIESIEMVN